jgi:uncharacterized protein with GYD domain
MLSTLTDEGREDGQVHPEPIKEVNKQLAPLAATVKTQYAVLGPYDFVSIVDARDYGTIARVSAELGSRGSIKLMTLTAISIDDFIASLKK